MMEKIAALFYGFEAVDNAVASATQIRKTENSDYKELKQIDTAAKEILGMSQLSFKSQIWTKSCKKRKSWKRMLKTSMKK